uniref:Uncharacterized protein n=1 Tax=uncultured bacterium Contig575 TaxID=1393592 RepID=W0FLN9_9BACT|nr:hypothetical protein [uncultured bacterium Contig575]
MTDMDTLLFFDKNPRALPIYEALEDILYQLFPNAHKRVQKTQAAG